MMKFTDRYHAGKILAENLQTYGNHPDTIVLALPRGGVPIGYEIARELSLPLEVFIVRKLGLPGHEELAMGAIAPNGITVFNEELLQELSVPKNAIDQVIQSETEELKRREQAYRGDRAFPNLKNKTIILVDDGIATGASIRVAIKALRHYDPKKIILAVPVASKSTYEEMKKLVDEVVCPLTPEEFYAVGLWYDDFSQTTDNEVFNLLSILSKQNE